MEGQAQPPDSPGASKGAAPGGLPKSSQPAASGAAESWKPTDGVLLAGLVACTAMAERLDLAGRTVSAVLAAGDVKATPPNWALWVAVIAFSAGFGSLTIRRSLSVARSLAVKRKWIARFKAMAWTAFGLWLAWQVLDWLVAIAGLPVRSTLPNLLHVGAIIMAIAALGSGGQAIIGDPKAAWKRTSFIRVQLILIGALLAVVLVVPLTASQVIDVLRSWGEDLGTAILGLAGALLLGAVCRASAYRMLVPSCVDKPYDAATGTRRIDRSVSYRSLMLGPPLVLATLSIIVGGWLGIGVAGVAVVLGLCTRWAVPIPGKTALSGEDELAARRLAGTLGAVPLGIVFAGLCAATLESFLLPGPRTSSDAVLVIVTVGAGTLFGLIGATAHTDLGTGLSGKKPALYGLAGFLLALAAGVTPDALPGADLALAFLLMALCALLAFRLVGGRGAPELWTGGGVAVGIACAVYAEPIANSRGVGSVGLVLIAGSGVLVILHALAALSTRRAWIASGWPLPERVPIVTLLVIWIAIAAASPQETAHQARTIDAAPGTQDISAAVRAWLAPHEDQPPSYLPMLVVGASGGGSKAAYWTDLVLDCIAGAGVPSDDTGNECSPHDDAAERRASLFLTSSVSGGSIGVFHLLQNFDKVGTHAAWIEEHAGREVLSPITAWGLFHDAPALLLRARSDPRDCEGRWSCWLNADRALVQEAAIAGRSDETGFPRGTGPRLAQAGDQGPVPVFNSSVSGGDGRLLLSPLRLAPPRPADRGCETLPRPAGSRVKEAATEPAAGSVDAHDLLQSKQDLPLITAAVLSARFPVIAPPGRVGDDDNSSGCKARPPLPPLYARDGGYTENTGLLTITELLPAIIAAVEKWKGRNGSRSRTRVQIIVISIDDDPTVLDADPVLLEPGLDTFSITQRAGPGYLSRLARDRLTSCQYPGVSYLRISPRPHAGARAATGWHVSGTTGRRDLGASLAHPRARKRIDLVRGALDGRPLRECSATAPAGDG